MWIPYEPSSNPLGYCLSFMSLQILLLRLSIFFQLVLSQSELTVGQNGTGNEVVSSLLVNILFCAATSPFWIMAFSILCLEFKMTDLGNLLYFTEKHSGWLINCRTLAFVSYVSCEKVLPSQVWLFSRCLGHTVVMQLEQKIPMPVSLGMCRYLPYPIYDHAVYLKLCDHRSRVTCAYICWC